MEKRLVIAIGLSILILLVWSALAPKQYHIENKEVTKIASSLAVKGSSTAKLALTPEPEYDSSSLFQFDHNKMQITFIEELAAIKEVVFKDHQNYRFSLKYGLLLRDQNLRFKKIRSSSDAVVFEHKDSVKRVTKRFTFDALSYAVRLEVITENLSNFPLAVDEVLLLGVLDFSSKLGQPQYQGVVITTPEKVWHLNGQKQLDISQAEFVALKDRYFCLIIEPEKLCQSFIKKLTAQQSEIGLNVQFGNVQFGQQIGHSYKLYLGPQDITLINNVQSKWSGIINYGTFDFISQILLQALQFFYKLVHNWGWAIVILSIAIYFLLYPLSLKQMRSMKEMQALQPRIEELRKNYKDNPQRLNKEIMELYKEHKVNPFSGCLPLLLQMPIFFALYQALMRSVALKGARFLWIKDLSEPDRLFTLPVSIPVLGNEINILPILMTIGMFIQQKLSTVSTASSAEQQKIMMIIFPLLFGFIFYHMPSGLVLYWFINSALMLIYQFRISRSK